MGIKYFFMFLFSIGIFFNVYADTNGVWHDAKDIRPGIIGSDENPGEYIFNNVIKYKGTELDLRYVNENQVSSISSGMVIDNSITVADTSPDIDQAVLWRHQRNTDTQIITGGKILKTTSKGANLNGNFYADKFCFNNGAGCLTFNGVSGGSSGATGATGATGSSSGSLWGLNGQDIFRSSGKVGIGTNIPGAALEVIGQTDSVGFTGVRIRSLDSGGAPGLGFYRPVDAEHYAGHVGVASLSGQFSDDSNSGDIVLRGAKNADVRLSTISGSKSIKTGLLLKNNGNVGIGVSNPSVKLEVAGNIIASNPTSGNHVATKDYVDSIAVGGSSGSSSSSSTLGQNACYWEYLNNCGHSCGGLAYFKICKSGYYMAGYGLSTFDHYATHGHRIYCCKP